LSPVSVNQQIPRKPENPRSETDPFDLETGDRFPHLQEHGFRQVFGFPQIPNPAADKAENGRHVTFIQVTECSGIALHGAPYKGFLGVG
jgi:hypothetical protein